MGRLNRIFREARRRFSETGFASLIEMHGFIIYRQQTLRRMDRRHSLGNQNIFKWAVLIINQTLLPFEFEFKFKLNYIVPFNSTVSP